MTPSELRWASRIFACVLSPRDLEVVIGDLEEEHRLQSRSWCRSQVVRSLPYLLWASIRRGGLVATVSTALGACLVQAIIELTTKSVLSPLLSDHAALPALLALLVTIPTLIFVSYLATRIRPGAAIALTGLIVMAIAGQLIVQPGINSTVWNQIIALLIAPPAAFAGGVVAVRPKSQARVR